MNNLLRVLALVSMVGLIFSTGGGKVAAQAKTANTGFKVSISVKVIDNVDGNATQVKKNFTEAFKAIGIEVVEQGDGDDNTVDLDITTGRDDDDDDNDGITDDKDNDDDGDGEDDAAEQVEIIDLDAEAGNLTDDFVDKDKSSGIYFEIDGDDGIEMEFITDADSLSETAASSSALFSGSDIFRKVSFNRSNNPSLLIPSAECLRQKMVLRTSLARCKTAACKNSLNSNYKASGCL